MSVRVEVVFATQQEANFWMWVYNTPHLTVDGTCTETLDKLEYSSKDEREDKRDRAECSQRSNG